MPLINDFKETKIFLSNKLIGAQLDNFRVYNLELQLNFISSSNIGLKSYWLCVTGEIKIICKKNIYSNRSEVIAFLHSIIGQKVESIDIEYGGILSIFYSGTVIKVSMDDESLEVVWSLTPESPNSYVKNNWSVIFTDESDLVMYPVN